MQRSQNSKFLTPRLITGSHLDQAVPLVTEMLEATAYSRFPISHKKMCEGIEFFLESPDALTIGFYDEKEMCGFFCARASTFWFSDATFTTDIGVFRHNRSKKILPFRRLLRLYHEWAHSKGAVRVDISQAVGNKGLKLESLFSRMGFERRGSIFSHYPESG